MTHFVNINMQRPRFTFLDTKCIGRRCFYPVMFEGTDRNGYPACSNRKHRGCPDPLPPFESATAELNRAAGWRVAKP